MIKLKLYLLILLSNTNDIDKIKSIYLLENSVYESKTTCAIIMFETGRMTCIKNKKKVCALNFNNLPGFYYKKKYLRFSSYSESLKYYIRWQKKYWIPYHKKYPNKSYLDFLEYIPYCNNMKQYNKTIKNLEKEKLWKK